jgi:hypothetical protein
VRVVQDGNNIKINIVYSKLHIAPCTGVRDVRVVRFPRGGVSPPFMSCNPKIPQMEDLGTPMSPKSCPTSLLSEWAAQTPQSKRLHEAAATHILGRSDTSFITAVVLRSAGGLVNILLEAVSAVYGGAIKGNQVALGCVCVASAANMTVSKQLGWDSRAQTHAEYAGHYSELARLIPSERALARLNDSTFASIGELIKKAQMELGRMEDGALPIPDCIEKRLGARVPPSPARSPGLLGV